MTSYLGRLFQDLCIKDNGGAQPLIESYTFIKVRFLILILVVYTPADLSRAKALFSMPPSLWGGLGDPISGDDTCCGGNGQGKFRSVYEFAFLWDPDRAGGAPL